MPDEANDSDACRNRNLPTREQALMTLHYTEGWLWGAEHEAASEYLRKGLSEIADQMIEDECAVPDDLSIRLELEAYRREDLRQREWAAFVRESDVRCLKCDLRYGERDQYGCGGYVGSHAYDDEELAEARKLDDPDIPRVD